MQTLTTTAAREELGVSVQAISSAIQRGRLQAEKDPRGRWQIARRSLSAYARDRAAGIRRASPNRISA